MNKKSKSEKGEIPPKETPKENPPAKLTRSETERVIGGVAGGLGEYFKIDPLIFRILLIILALQGGGVLLYLILWLIIPSPSQVNQPPKETIRANVSEVKGKAKNLVNNLRFPKRGSSFLIGLGVGILFLGALLLSENLGWLHIWHWRWFWPLCLIFIGVTILKNNHD